MLCSKRSAALLASAGCLLTLFGCVGLNNVSELDAAQHDQLSAQKAVLLYGSELQSPWQTVGLPRPSGLSFEEYDVATGRNKSRCGRSNRTNGTIDTTRTGAATFSAFVVDPGYFVLSAFSAPGRALSDAGAFYAARGTVNYVGVYVYKGEDQGFELRRDLAEGQTAARQFSGLSWPVVVASTVPVRDNTPLVCSP